MESKETKLAVLIDAENVPPTKIKSMLNELTRYGDPIIKRIYGDWTTPQVGGWKSTLLEHAIIPVQQYKYTSGKNSTDSAMIIDAMDILHRDNVDGFGLISSDSDFTRLATRIRESGKLVIGMGEEKTPKPFVTACNRFIYIELLQKALRKDVKEFKPTMTKEELIDLLNQSIDVLADDSGWVFLGDLGNLLLKKQPDFDSRCFGYPKLSVMFESLDNLYVIEKRAMERAQGFLMFVRRK
jgi:uncharacterized protein (TIGR00288 family)